MVVGFIEKQRAASLVQQAQAAEYARDPAKIRVFLTSSVRVPSSKRDVEETF